MRAHSRRGGFESEVHRKVVTEEPGGRTEDLRLPYSSEALNNAHVTSRQERWKCALVQAESSIPSGLR